MKRADRKAVERLLKNAEASLSDARLDLLAYDVCLSALRDALGWVKRAKRERKRIEENDPCP